jgi:hypothetical protein
VKDASGKKAAEILFLRVAPRGLIRPVSGTRGSGPNRFGAVFAADGIRGRVGERDFASFWIGMGRRVRMPGRQLLQRLREGGITDIVDIGCAGALDTALRRGDLVLSSADFPFDAAVPIGVHRRGGLDSLLQDVAASRGVRLHAAPVLTHERFISSRAERIELFERTGCAAVQMEHAWFLQLLQTLLPVDRYEKIRVTHLVLITDAVPRSTGRMASARSWRDALVGYLLPGGRDGIASLRRQVLSSWPTE